MVSAAQAESIRGESTAKEFNKDKIHEQPLFKATMPETTNFSKVLVKSDGHPTLAIIDIQTHR